MGIRGTAEFREGIRRYAEMHWNRWYALVSYAKSALWIVPFLALLVEQVVVRLADGLNAWLVASGRIDATTSFFGMSSGGARSMLEPRFPISPDF